MFNNTPTFWANSWNRHFEEYIQYVPFQAYYLYCLLGEYDANVLEIAGGSFHDTSALNNWGIACTGIDTCREVIEKAKKAEPTLNRKVLEMDAKQMDFRDKTFDVSFHNGFFAYFSSDEELRLLIREQVRVTKRLIVCSVHNALNDWLREKFRIFSRKDDLYNLRFYTPQRIRSLLTPFCRRVEIFPLQVPEFDRLITMTNARDFVKGIYNKYYHACDIRRCKRLMAVGYL
ncbi:MAG: class I SAM-dependent methyltransferase [Candidatus Omnitrophica bacterium]|nr:class I SAM-dependent methyltransferase [Candidatus Omnitrophota bacterium]